MFILTPLFIKGEIDYGEINQISFCCFLFSSALGELIAQFGNLGWFSSYVERFAKFSDALDTVTQKKTR
ncbi:hypothetical protein AB0758_24100 [Tolypothrix bouteillei VB521301_2]